MIVEITGTLVSVQHKIPEGNQKFQPHQLLNVLQIDDNGQAEIIPVKDEILSRKYEENKIIKLKTSLAQWSMNGRNGLTVKVL